MNSNTKSKRTERIVLTGAVITAVTLALVTAGIVVSITPIQTAHASCVTNPKNAATACSGSGGTSSCSTACGGPLPGATDSFSVDSKGAHNACSSAFGSFSTNSGHPSATSGHGGC